MTFHLPCKKVKLKNQTRYLIDAAEFWKWAENHGEEIMYALGCIACFGFVVVIIAALLDL